MKFWEILLIVPVVLILYLGRQIADLGRDAAKDSPSQRTLRRSMVAVLAFLVLAMLYAVVRDTFFRGR